MTRILLISAVIAGAITSGAAAAGDVYRFNGDDGTVHFTNAPTDPRYQRMGFVSGTQAGWLRLPNAEDGRYLSEIRQAATRYGVPERLVSSVIRVESGFNPHAVSVKGARGLMQLMPGTASMLGVRNSFDPGQNIDGGVRHLRGLIDRFGNLPLALAAYNAGDRAVVAHGGIPPFPETQSYVTKVLRLYSGGSSAPQVIYRTVEPDGTITYTNIPPRVRR